MEIFFAFIAGTLTMLAPCIIPVLPIVLAGGTDRGRARPFGLAVGIILSFTLTTVFLSWAVQHARISPSIDRSIGIVFLILFGVSMAFPGMVFQITKYFPHRKIRGTGTGWWGGFVLGTGLGAVWAPCVGPILGGILTAAQVANFSFNIILSAVAFAAGVATPLSIIAFFGQRIRLHLRFFTIWSGRIQQVFGIFLILASVGFIFRFDIRIQEFALQSRPAWAPFLLRCESGLMPTLQKEVPKIQLEVDIEGRF